MCIMLLASRKHDCVDILLNKCIIEHFTILLIGHFIDDIYWTISFVEHFTVLFHWCTDLYWTFHCLIDHTSVIEHFTVLLNFNVLMTIVLFNISLSWNANETFIFVYLREILYLQQACICCISEYKCNKLTIRLYSIILLGFLKKSYFSLSHKQCTFLSC